MPLDKFPALLLFGFVYGWWLGLCTFTWSVVGGDGEGWDLVSEEGVD